MKRFGWQWLAISSLLLVDLAAVAGTRPQYGGTLRVAMHSALNSLDPADGTQPDSLARRNVTLLMFEPLVTMDENGRLRPGLATSWQAYSPTQVADQGGQRWEFRLRRDVRFHDGTALTADMVVLSLRTANPTWNVSGSADSIIIELEAADPKLPAELALPRNAIVKRNSDGSLSGTGPFYPTEWQAGKRLSLAAEENSWRGRPFLDSIEIEMGKTFHDEMIALELGKADLVDVPPEQLHRISMEGKVVTDSAPIELLALLFSREAKSEDEIFLRQALALSVERSSMRTVLLQGAGQAAGSILPNWMSGYGFVFPTDADLPRARHLREQVRKIPTWTVGYEADDSMSRLLAERIALNARDAGLTLQPTAAASADLRLVRIPLASADPAVSLAAVANFCSLPGPKIGGTAEALYAAEKTMLALGRLLPLFHLPASYAAANTVKNWLPRSDGGWNLTDVWLESAKP